MNKENINALADFIDKMSLRFDMHESHCNPGCGSAGCIGGSAAALWPDVRGYTSPGAPKETFTWNDDKLANKLRISSADHDELCYECNGLPFSDISQSMAVSTLRRLAETGKVVFIDT